MPLELGIGRLIAPIPYLDRVTQRLRNPPDVCRVAHIDVLFVSAPLKPEQLVSEVVCGLGDDHPGVIDEGDRCGTGVPTERFLDRPLDDMPVEPTMEIQRRAGSRPRVAAGNNAPFRQAFGVPIGGRTHAAIGFAGIANRLKRGCFGRQGPRAAGVARSPRHLSQNNRNQMRFGGLPAARQGAN